MQDDNATVFISLTVFLLAFLLETYDADDTSLYWHKLFRHMTLSLRGLRPSNTLFRKHSLRRASLGKVGNLRLRGAHDIPSDTYVELQSTRNNCISQPYPRSASMCLRSQNVGNFDRESLNHPQPTPTLCVV